MTTDESIQPLGRASTPVPFMVRLHPGQLPDAAPSCQGPKSFRVPMQVGQVRLGSDPSTPVKAFPDLPVTACIANNLIVDLDREGYLQTVERVQPLGIAHFGAGRLTKQCQNPCFVTAGAYRVEGVGYGCPTPCATVATGHEPGAAPLEVDRVRDDVGRARRAGSKHIVAGVYWGDDGIGLPRAEVVATALAILDSGFDPLVSHHTHCVRPEVTDSGRRIHFSVGDATLPNFDFTDEAPRRLTCWRWWNHSTIAVDSGPGIGRITTRAPCARAQTASASARVTTRHTCARLRAVDATASWTTRRAMRRRWGATGSLAMRAWARLDSTLGPTRVKSRPTPKTVGGWSRAA